MSKTKKSTNKVDFKEVMVDDKLTIKWDVEVTKIEDLEDYLRPNDERQVRKVTCKIVTGPWRDREATFIILDDDKVVLHPRPSGWSTWKAFWFGSKKAKKKKAIVAT